MNSEKITIAIPTFKRPQSLKGGLERLDELHNIDSRFGILVIDDSGSARFNNLNERVIDGFRNKTGLCVKYVVNDRNRGFPETLIKLFENTESEYMLLMSDDDLILARYFSEIVDFIFAHKPVLLAPQFLDGDRKHLTRGKKETRLIKPREYRICCGHAPGLIFHVPSYRNQIKKIKSRISRGCAATLTYPTVSFTFDLLLDGAEMYWYHKPLVMLGDDMPSGIKDQHGDHYSNMASRIQQIAAFDLMVLEHEESQLRNEVLFETRAWSFKKALSAERHLKELIVRETELSIILKCLFYKVKNRLRARSA